LVTASVDIDNAIRLSPNSVFAHANRALVYSKRKIFDLAISAATKVVSLKPTDSEPYLNRGDIFKESGDLTSALSDYDQVIKLSPLDSTPYKRRIQVFKDMKANAQLEAEFERLIKALPADGLNERGHHYYFEKEYKKAIADFLELQKQDPNGGIAEVMLLMCFENLGDHSQAFKYANDRVIRHPNSNTYIDRGRILMLSRRFDEALFDFDRAVGLSPKNYYGLRLRGDARTAKGDLVGAMDDYVRSLAIFDRSPETYFSRAMLYVMLKRKPEAEADLRKALELDPKNLKAKTELDKLTKGVPKRPDRK
jgi:tetratricopeptide (TPR) repeat protein